MLRFDRRQYWRSHEELEELWLRDRRDVYKGLIQVAAAFVHIGRANWRGAVSKLEQALENLHGAGERHRGLDLVAVRERAGAVAEHVRALAAGDTEEFDEELRFTLEACFEGDLAGVELEEMELPYRVRRHREGYRIGRDPHRRD
ncbi:MAG: DUF309 domain-containing protein [Acidobacteriota bacterium]